VYAEDASRKFLPSIGFLKKYIEPAARPGLRIDTGVQEGSEISMFYDPMISKLITHADTREEAFKLLDECIDEYVIQGVVDNLGFCKSMIHNELIKKGTYDTSFIGKHYPQGYQGEPLTGSDEHYISALAAVVKNISIKNETPIGESPHVLKTAFVVLSNDKHYKLEIDDSNEKFTVWHVQKPEVAPVVIEVKNLKLVKNASIRADVTINGKT